MNFMAIFSWGGQAALEAYSYMFPGFFFNTGMARVVGRTNKLRNRKYLAHPFFGGLTDWAGWRRPDLRGRPLYRLLAALGLMP
jgi:hypothetical protein